MSQRRVRDGQIFAPAHFGRVGVQVKETDTNKISRSSFSAVFFVQVLVAISAHTVRLREAD